MKINKWSIPITAILLLLSGGYIWINWNIVPEFFVFVWIMLAITTIMANWGHYEEYARNKLRDDESN